MTVSLTLVCSASDRTQRILDGRIGIRGANISILSLPAEEMFSRAFETAEFDVTELSFSNFTRLTLEGACDYIGLPIFPSRTFRHSAIYIRTDRGIRTPADLRGRTIGVREYSNTATLVVKGMLADEYGVEASEIRWRVGDVDVPERAEIPVPQVPPAFDIVAVPPGGLLSDMLAEGDLDALVSYSPPACFGQAGVPVERLFPDYAQAEQDYFQRTGIFPIMHLIGIRRRLAQQHPELARSLFEAFSAAKDAAIADLAVMQSLKVALPWCHAELSRTQAVMGADFWPYGIKRNLEAIRSLLRYSHSQGLTPRLATIEELFEPSLLDT